MKNMQLKSLSLGLAALAAAVGAATAVGATMSPGDWGCGGGSPLTQSVLNKCLPGETNQAPCQVLEWEPMPTQCSAVGPQPTCNYCKDGSVDGLWVTTPGECFEGICMPTGEATKRRSPIPQVEFSGSDCKLCPENG